MKFSLKHLREQWDQLLVRFWYARYKDEFNQRGIRRVLSLTPEEKKRRGIERTVRLVSNSRGMWNLTLEQTPQQSCQWGRTLFVGSGPADHYIVVTALPKPPPEGPGLDFEMPGPERVWGWQMEPEEYVVKLGFDNPAEHALMSRFYTNVDFQIARGGIYRGAPPYVFWHLIRTWDWLKKASMPRKSIQLGVINSGLQNISGHERRREFMKRLDRSSLDYAMWGRGIEHGEYRGYRGFAPSKWRVHAASRYSIVMENTIADFYWSEKIADALLAWSVPLYYGSPKIFDYFPEEAIIPIDIRDPDCVRRIESLMASDRWEKRIPALNEARRLLLEKENLYAFLDAELDAAGITGNRG